jgi:hypothetical protein
MNWIKGKLGGTIISAIDPSLSKATSDFLEKSYYGGDLIAESINPKNIDLILAAPDMLEFCKDIALDCERLSLTIEQLSALKAALLKADPNVFYNKQMQGRLKR